MRWYAVGNIGEGGRTRGDVGAGRREVDVDRARAGSGVGDPQRKETVAWIVERVVAEHRTYACKRAKNDVGVFGAPTDGIGRVD